MSNKGIVPIHLRNIPWPMEIFDHPQFMASIAKWYRPNLCVEYGLASCTTTQVLSPHCKRYIGVDINHHPNMDMIPNLEFHQMSTKKFKTEVLDYIEQPVEMAFIDADHHSEVAFQDFEDLFEKLIDNGIIFIHDTYPCNEQSTSFTFCGDSWKVPGMIKRKYGDVCDVFTIPIQPGLTMVRKHPTIPMDHMTTSK